jgi:cobyrinic acid a,c-diamide synthase
VVSDIPSPAQVFRNVRSRQSTSRVSDAVQMRMEVPVSGLVTCRVQVAMMDYREVHLGLRSCMKSI